jgi:hypothetical protein
VLQGDNAKQWKMGGPCAAAALNFKSQVGSRFQVVE